MSNLGKAHDNGPNYKAVFKLIFTQVTGHEELIYCTLNLPQYTAKVYAMACGILIFVIFITISTSQVATGANILFFFIGGTYSHKLSVWPLACSLADKGHNVTVFSRFKMQPRPHPLITDLTSDQVDKFAKTLPPFDPIESRRREETLQLWRSVFSISLQLCEIFMTKTDDDPVLRYLVHDAKFDLVINNAVVSDCGYILAHRYEAKLIISSSTVVLPWYLELFGIPSEASWVPDWSGESKFPMNFFDRWTSFYRPTYYYVYRQLYFYPVMERIAETVYGRDASQGLSLLETEKSASLVLIHSHFSVGFPRSYPPMFVDVGGMQCWEAKLPLPSTLQLLLDSSEKVILVSFGSTIDASMVNDSLKTVLLEAMEKLSSFQFILRGNSSKSQEYPPNVFLSQWLPQREILNHPKVLAFLTHGGLNGLAEATFAAVPLIVIPLFADQDYNAYRIEAESLGIRLELRELSSQGIVRAVNAITGNLM